MIIDTDVIVAGLRSRTGASAELVRKILRGELELELLVALALEYEAVATRDEHLTAGGLTASDAMTVIDALVAVAKPVEVNFRWRPQLRDVDDEFVFEAAINARNKMIVTFNRKHFEEAALRFNVSIARPAEILETLR
jgi:predicted nucleic acid-binding protein